MKLPQSVYIKYYLLGGTYMVYETFQTMLTQHLSQRLGPGCQLLVQPVPKNNGITLDGLCISQNGSSVTPAVYLNNYFEQYQDGMSMESIVEEIQQLYREDSALLHTDFSILNDFSKLKDKIVYKLVHTDANRELLKEIPSVPYLDFSVIFYLYLEENETGQLTALIHNFHLAAWNTTTEEIYQLAIYNTPICFPPDLKPMSQVMSDVLCQEMDLDELESVVEDLSRSQARSPLYVLTNSTGINGAGTILYPQVLSNFSQQLNQDLVILPSSIHEVLLVPYDKTISLDKLSDMVNQINQTEVSVEEQLSDHVYYYSRESDQVLILQDSACHAPC